jgi:hypothetical protein
MSVRGRENLCNMTSGGDGVRGMSPETKAKMRARNYQNKSGYRCVYPFMYSKKNPWIAKIKQNGKEIYLGTFPTAIEAAKAYNRKAIELYGDKARLNMIPQ